jgi:hypothetical protein
VEVPAADSDYAEARSLYLTKFPQAALNFDLGDFALYRIQPRWARFVAGFGQIFNLTLADFKQTAAPGLDEGD